MKAFTDISQGKKLAEILPIETADMRYDEYISYIDGTPKVGYKKGVTDGIPCWSLAALLGVLPDYTLQDNPNGTVFVVSEKEKPIMSDDYDNPVDACYEMIKLLHTKHLL